MMKSRKTIVCCIVFILMLVLGGCSRKLAKIKEGDVVIDLTEKFDPASVLYDIKEGTDITYVLDQESNILFITLINEDKEKVLEIPVTIKEPQYEVAEQIIIDKDKGFDVRSFVKTEEGVSIDCVIDETSRIIKITLKKGLWTKYFEKEFKYASEIDGVNSFDDSLNGEVVSENELTPIIDDSDNEYSPESQSDDVNNEEDDRENKYDDDDLDDNELPLIADD